MAVYKYIRVSTNSQDVGRQEMLLENIKADKVYIDKVTGSNIDRPELNKLRLKATIGDNIYVESISRLGRNVDDLRALCEEFKNKGVIIHFLKEGLSTSGDTYKFLLTVLGAVAEMERELIVERVKDGIAKAQKYGTKSGIPIGRPEAKPPKTFEKYYKQWEDKQITAVEFAKLIEVSRTTLYRYIKKYREEQGETEYVVETDNKGNKYKQYKV